MRQAVAAGLVAVAAAASVARAELSYRVVLLKPPVTDDVTSDALARVRGELTAAGFEVSMLPQDAVLDVRTALEWYERYLSESPRGTYAAQALGRRMILVHKLRGSAAARPIASEYLERFPSGAYAEPAKKLLRD